MSQGPTRNILTIIGRRFLDSFKLQKNQLQKGILKGEDYFGNKYYEIPAEPQVGRRKAARWFDPPIKEDHSQEIPGEWESWLRGRRPDPPTKEELMKNLAIAQMKKQNAAKLEGKADIDRGHKIEIDDEKGYGSFPKYQEYEIMPGKSKKENE